MLLVLLLALLVYAWLPKVRRFSSEPGFKDPSFWEFITRGGAALVASWCFCIYCRVEAWNWSLIDLLAFIVPIILWPWIEFFVHKYQMHRIPWTPVFDSHHEHHRCPHDPLSGITPLAYNGLIVAAAIIIKLWGFLFLRTSLVSLIFLLLFYDWVHYLIHTNHKPITWWGRKIRANHIRHHFIDDSRFNGLLWPWSDQK